MPQQETSSLKSYFDEIAETDGDNECRAWLDTLFDNKAEVADSVAQLLEGRGPGTYVGFLKGSFNFSFRIRFSEGFSDVLVRFPKPGHTATDLRNEKVENEVHTIEYLRQHTTIPLPTVHSWGTTAKPTTKTAARNLLQFGPFIIMDYIEGTLLSTILRQPDREDMVLNPNIDKTILDKIYRQIADYMLQISRLRFPRIGAMSKDDHANWVIRRPLTYNMNELATVAFYPGDRFPTAPMDRASDYFRSVANEHLQHLWTQRNLADDEEIARKRFIARRHFAQLIPKYCIDDDDTGPFIPFCDDLRPANMLVNPETLQITAVFDFEFTNSMPAQFAYDPPWWLLLSAPETWLDRCALQEFLALYEPRMEQFVQMLEHVEAESSKQPGALPLSARMRDSWRTRRFWFNYAARKSFAVDSIYWATLHDDSVVLEDQARAEMESFTQRKMEQLEAYDDECSARFS